MSYLSNYRTDDAKYYLSDDKGKAIIIAKLIDADSINRAVSLLYGNDLYIDVLNAIKEILTEEKERLLNIALGGEDEDDTEEKNR